MQQREIKIHEGCNVEKDIKRLLKRKLGNLKCPLDNGDRTTLSVEVTGNIS